MADVGDVDCGLPLRADLAAQAFLHVGAVTRKQRAERILFPGGGIRRTSSTSDVSMALERSRSQHRR